MLRRGSPLVPFEVPSGHFRGGVLRGASNEVGFLNCAVAVASSAGARQKRSPPRSLDCIAEVRNGFRGRRLPLGGEGDRHPRTAPARAATHRRQPRNCQRRGRQSRAADARPFERCDDDGRLRTPVQRSPRRGRRRARQRPIRGLRSAALLSMLKILLPKCCQTPMWSTWPPPRRKVKPQVRHQIRMAPPARFELALPPPEGGALSPELRGPACSGAAGPGSGPKGNVPA